MSEKPFHGITAYKCAQCGKHVPIDVRLPNEFEHGQWEALFKKIQEKKMICLSCRK